MKKVLVRNLQAGMVTAEDIFAIDGQLIVPKKVILNDRTIEKLISFAIYSIRVEDELSTAAETHDTDDSYSERIKVSPQFLAFRSSFEKNVETLKIGMNRIVDLNSTTDAENMLSQTLTLMDDNRNGSISLMDMLLSMREIDDSTYAHCISVSMICNILAGWLHMNQEDRILATSCGLFADIGKIRIPEQIINKPGPLTKAEYEAVKRHPIDGYNILNKTGLHEEVKNAALMHHERNDGSGYPYGFTSNKISRFAKLVAIADIYDAMTSPRPQRYALCPFEAISVFEQESYDKFDADILLTFLKNISNSFIGQRVRLSNGLEGEIIFIHPENLSKPTIKCGDKFVDLTKYKDTRIVSII